MAFGVTSLLHSQAFGNISTLQARSSAGWSNAVSCSDLDSIKIFHNNTCGRSAISAAMHESHPWPFIGECVQSEHMMSDVSLKRRSGEESVVPASSIRHFLGQSICTMLLQHPVIPRPEHLLDIKSGALLHFEGAELVTIPITRSMSMVMAGAASVTPTIKQHIPASLVQKIWLHR